MLRRFLFRRPGPLARYDGFDAAAKPRLGASLDDAALDYHRATPAGKMSTAPTKPLATPRDLALAYSPGVAAACRAIDADQREINALTNRGILVAVVTNGTAVLGLGGIGPYAAKPVMEGKAALFKRFGDVDAVDICLDEADPVKLAEMIVALEPTVGGVNLEDIRAPDCFVVEEVCRERMNVPVFHDDQHGTAICVLAALENALLLTGRRLEDVRLVCSGAGAAAMATLDLLFASGLSRENVLVTDRDGVIFEGRRTNMSPHKEKLAARTRVRTLEKALDGADVFLGLSVGGVLNPAWIAGMAEKPIILALANPEPEVWPAHALEVSPNAIVATGRSDLPNQVNNVLCFPYLFRGVFDAGAKQFTARMYVEAARAIAAVAREAPTETLRAFYPNDALEFGPASIMPRPFDDRLAAVVPAAVRNAAKEI